MCLGDSPAPGPSTMVLYLTASPEQWSSRLGTETWTLWASTCLSSINLFLHSSCPSLDLTNSLVTVRKTLWAAPLGFANLWSLHALNLKLWHLKRTQAFLLCHPATQGAHHAAITCITCAFLWFGTAGAYETCHPGQTLLFGSEETAIILYWCLQRTQNYI